MFRSLNRRYAAAVLTVAAVIAATSACSSDADDTPPASPTGSTGGSAVPSESGSDAPAALVQAAKAEGSMTFYSAFLEAPGTRLVEAFKKKYGINATFVRVSGVDGYTKFSTEAQSGKPVADVYAGTSVAYTNDAAQKGFIQNISTTEIPDLDNVPAKFRGDHYVTVSMNVFGMCYNTDNLKESDMPKTWADIGSSKYKDRTLMPDPSNTEVYVNTWEGVRREFGDKVLTDVAANKPRLSESVVPAVQSLAAGEGDILLQCVGSVADSVKQEGAPVEFYEPSGPVFGAEVYATLAKGPHPNAGKLFIDFLLSPEAAQLIAQDPGTYSATDLPDEYRPVLDVAAQVKPKILSLLGIS
jgi:iron(III) transport system substrate-binding protein